MAMPQWGQQRWNEPPTKKSNVGLNIALVVGVIFLLAAISLGIYFATKSDESESSGSGSGGGGGGGGGGTAALNCNASGTFDAARVYYANKGENAGKYTMTPSFGAKVDEFTCDIRYNYNAIAAGVADAKGIDWRRFTFSYNPTTKKYEATAMGAPGSGILAKG